MAENSFKIGNCSFDSRAILAPMAGITDMPFRILCRELGCGLVYTEMVSAKGMHYSSSKTAELLEINEAEKPVAVQLFGSDADILAETVCRLEDSQCVMFDLNMGCPATKIVRNGDGSALMKDIGKAEKVIRSVARASEKTGGRPVTVKFRKGWDEQSVIAVEFAKMAEAAGAAAVTVHGRTAKQMYKGNADWDIILRVKQAVGIPVIGNGDVTGAETAVRMLEQTGCDAVMVGRAAQGNPWVFAQINRAFEELGSQGAQVVQKPIESEKCGEFVISNKERYNMICRHFDMLTKLKGERIAVNEMRMHIPCYVRGLPGAAAFRKEQMTCLSMDSVKKLLERYLIG